VHSITRFYWAVRGVETGSDGCHRGSLLDQPAFHSPYVCPLIHIYALTNRNIPHTSEVTCPKEEAEMFVEAWARLSAHTPTDSPRTSFTLTKDYLVQSCNKVEPSLVEPFHPIAEVSPPYFSSRLLTYLYRQLRA